MMDEELLHETNEKIANMVKYGSRRVITHRQGYRMRWSDAHKKWFPAGRALPSGQYTIDANELIIEAPSTKIKEILPNLIDLPLYTNSNPARGRGESVYLPAGRYEEDEGGIEDRKKKSAKAKPKRKVIKKCKCK
jgi:hypothetical protein